MSQPAPMIALTLSVNATEQRADVAADTLLVDFLRETLGLTGTKVGCESGQCGACLVLLDGVSVKSCTLLAAQAADRAVTTVEGLASNGQLSQLQQYFSESHALQCGFCTPGMLISMSDLLAREATPDEQTIRRWLDGNLCRCGCYQNAVRAVQQVVATRQVAEQV